MELLDVVDENDEVVGVMAHADIDEKLLPHRIIHVLIFDGAGKMLLQKRSANKSFCPLHWSTSVGGHVQSGESYEAAALREFKEELGIILPIEFMFRTKYYDPRGFFMFLGIFKAVFNGPFEVNSEEVESLDAFSNEELHKMIDDGEPFHPELKFLLKNHYDVIFL